jgi:deoxyribose-phosphate aldolase
MKSDFGRYIDHTLLRPIGTVTDIRRLCTEAIEYGMAAVCIFPSYVPMARDLLRNTRVKIATVIAFPFGVTFTEIKEAEMRASAARGADEMDFVINIAALKSGEDKSVEEEMQYLTAKARTLGVVTKFIIETAYLTQDEKVRACKIGNRVRPDFMKTSTGYGPTGATVEDVRVMRSNLLPEIQIKAAGGIRSHAEAVQMLQAGAARLGTSSGIKIIEEASR